MQAPAHVAGHVVHREAGQGHSCGQRLVKEFKQAETSLNGRGR